MAKSENIFKTLKHYSGGYHNSNSEESNKIYDAKIAELTEKIKANVEQAPEIISEELKKYEIKKLKAALTKGIMPMIHCDAEWKAIDNITMALIDTKPLK